MKKFRMRRVGSALLAALMLAVTGAPAASAASRTQEVRVPETNIIVAPTLVSRVNSAADLEGLSDHSPAVAILKVDSEGNTPAGSLTEAVEKLGTTIIPAFQVEEQAEADALITWLDDNNPNEAFVLSSKGELIQAVRKKKFKFRGILDMTGTQTDPDAEGALLSIRQAVNSCGSKTVLLPESLADKETVMALQEWLLTVWIDAGEETLDKVTGARVLTSGCNGVVSSARAELEDWMTSLFPANTMTRTPFVVGHRGIPDQAPENTIESSQLAVEKGADIVELDIYVTKDKELVVIHDGTLDRTTNGTGNVQNMTLEEIRQYTANQSYKVPSAYPDVKVPTFREYLEAFKDTDTQLFVELKSEQNDLVPLFVEQVKEYDMEDQISVISFSTGQIKRVNDQMPTMSCGLLTSGQMDGSEVDPGSSLIKILNATERYGTTYNPSSAGINKDFVKYIADRGMTIWPWTYTDREAFNRHFMYNVGALTTNDSSYAQYLPRLLQASIPEGLTEGGSVPFTVNTVEYGGGTPDVTAQAQIVMLGGDGEVAVGEDGTLQGVREGQATFLVTYEYKGIDNMNYALTTQPLTVQVRAMATILPGVDNSMFILFVAVAAVVLVVVVVVVAVILVVKRKKKA